MPRYLILVYFINNMCMYCKIFKKKLKGLIIKYLHCYIIIKFPYDLIQLCQFPTVTIVIHKNHLFFNQLAPTKKLVCTFFLIILKYYNIPYKNVKILKK